MNPSLRPRAQAYKRASVAEVRIARLEPKNQPKLLSKTQGGGFDRRIFRNVRRIVNSGSSLGPSCPFPLCFFSLWDYLLSRHVGELYTSSAPYDPLFWVIHPTADRLMGWRRKLAAEQPDV